MFPRIMPLGYLFALIVALAGCCAGICDAYALDQEAATKVGGELARYGEKLVVLRDASAKVLAAGPNVLAELAGAWERVATAPSTRGFDAELRFTGMALLVLALTVVLVRRATAGLRMACANDPVPARGAAGALGLDALDRIAVAAAAYVLIELWCDIDTTRDFVAVAVLWAFVRWWLSLWLAQALLRPFQPKFRLIAMKNMTAKAIFAIAAAVLWVGIAGISLMPVLLRSQMPIESAQFVVLLQGVVVAVGGLVALTVYRTSEIAGAESARRSSRRWFAVGLIMLVAVWVTWSVGTLLLNFSVYHSLVWSLRIAAFAYIIDAILSIPAAPPGASSADQPVSQFAGMWIPLLHGSIRIAAVLAIAILLAETWLVDELGVLKPAQWEPIRGSLVTASLTLLVGYVLWRYLSQWTEIRLRAAMPVMGATEDGERQPASRLTTVLPVLRILLGITIIVLASLVALAQLGVNIGPLLAGAGVIGLAISFGSQALVRDIVSGIFFMADDAFRVGEYIDTGRLKGTVEKISLRSMRLRHQNGQIHTIPFGQLTSITNFSRDWQIAKFNLRLARDIDVERVRRAVKQVGLDLMQDPEVAKELLEPLKLQGVAEIDDTAIVVRLKFTARPRRPNFVQREALKRIHKLFAEKGIPFASNAVTVQTTGQTPVSTDSAAAAGAYSSAAKRAIDAV